MNVTKENVDKIGKTIPAIKKPTISPLAEKGWFAIDTIIDKKQSKDLIPKLKKIGASGIVEYALNKLIY